MKTSKVSIAVVVKYTCIFGLSVTLALVSCGVIDDLTSFPICPTDLSYESDTIHIPDTTGTLPSVPCAASTGAVTCQSSAVSRSCTSPFSCEAQCNAESGQCELEATYRDIQEIDLRDQVSSKLEKFVLDRVSVTSLQYSIRENSLNIDIPRIDIYVGPATMRTEEDEGAVKLFTIPRVPAGESIESVSVDSFPEGKTAFEVFARDYETPFSMLVTIQYMTEAGETMPKGSAKIAVQPCLLFKLFD